MRFKITSLICFILATAVSLAAQSKIVTNADLEKYDRERLKNERDYRENYAKLGLPSPEDLERRREQSRIETEQLSAKLRTARLEIERIEAQREVNEQVTRVYQSQSQFASQPQFYGEPFYFWSNGRRYGRSVVRQSYYQQPGYFAGGQFWPTGSRTQSQPLIARSRTPRK